MNYIDWLTKVHRLIASRKPDIRTSDLDQNALLDSFNQGVNPVDFVMQDDLPIRDLSTLPTNAKAKQSSVPKAKESPSAMLIAVLVVAMLVTFYGVVNALTSIGHAVSNH
jgi:hypothetical protein